MTTSTPHGAPDGTLPIGVQAGAGALPGTGTPGMTHIGPGVGDRRGDGVHPGDGDRRGDGLPHGDGADPTTHATPAQEYPARAIAPDRELQPDAPATTYVPQWASAATVTREHRQSDRATTAVMDPRAGHLSALSARRWAQASVPLSAHNVRQATAVRPTTTATPIRVPHTITTATALTAHAHPHTTAEVPAVAAALEEAVVAEVAARQAADADATNSQTLIPCTVSTFRRG